MQRLSELLRGKVWFFGLPIGYCIGVNYTPKKETIAIFTSLIIDPLWVPYHRSKYILQRLEGWASLRDPKKMAAGGRHIQGGTLRAA